MARSLRERATSGRDAGAFAIVQASAVAELPIGFDAS